MCGAHKVQQVLLKIGPLAVLCDMGLAYSRRGKHEVVVLVVVAFFAIVVVELAGQDRIANMWIPHAQ